MKCETTLVYDAVFVCPKRNPYLYTDNDTLDRQSVILYLYFLSSQLTQKISKINILYTPCLRLYYYQVL